MRDITYTGATVNDNYYISCPNETIYVFQPNMILISLGSNYAADEEVTLTGGGFTFKRNAVNRSVKFDLTNMFRSVFTQFDLVYSGVRNDPFYNTLNISISANSNVKDIAFNLIFGAIQHDTPLIGLDRLYFPYWSGLPLAVNSGYPCETILIDSVQTVGRKLIEVVKTADTFNYGTYIGADSVQLITFQKRTCPEDGYYIRWVDQRGQVWHYKFTKKTDEGFSTINKSGEIIPQFPNSFDYSATYTRGLLTKKTQQRTFQGYANEDADVFSIIETVAQSLFVAVWMNNLWIDVKVKDMTTKSNGQYGSNIEFTFELPENYSMEL